MRTTLKVGSRSVCRNHRVTTGMVHDSLDEIGDSQSMKTASRATGGYSIVVVLASILLIYLVSPVIYFLFFYSWPQTGAVLSDPIAQGALVTSLLSATVSTGITALLGIPLGYVLARRTFRGRQALILLVYMPLVFPPVVSGILLLVLYGPYGLVGGPFASAGLELDTTFVGIVLAQIFVASPFVTIAARSAFEAVDPALEEVAATLGKSAWQIFWRINLPAARLGIVAGLLLGWLRALGEFGATAVMAYHPYTLPVYVYVQLSGLGVQPALGLLLFILPVSVVGGGLVLWFEERAARRRRHATH
jgi:ABC-type sulfate transport system permease component